MMRTYRIVLSVTLLTLAAVGAYSAFMYVYTENMFSPVPLLTAPYTDQLPSCASPGLTRFIHKVNTPARARQKDSSFAGFEVDVWTEGEAVFAAHDEQEARQQTALTAIFQAVEHPAQKKWWLDLKQELSPAQLEAILQAAGAYQIPPENLWWEAPAGATADLLKQRGLQLLLQLPEGFEQDQGDEVRRALLNAQLLALWQKYEPAALAASFGKYGQLRAYFPTMPKAIYYSSTVRPSLKKPLMSAHMQKDPSVCLFMTEEYTYLPF